MISQTSSVGNVLKVYMVNMVSSIMEMQRFVTPNSFVPYIMAEGMEQGKRGPTYGLSGEDSIVTPSSESTIAGASTMAVVGKPPDGT